MALQEQHLDRRRSNLVVMALREISRKFVFTNCLYILCITPTALAASLRLNSARFLFSGPAIFGMWMLVNASVDMRYRLDDYLRWLQRKKSGQLGLFERLYVYVNPGWFGDMDESQVLAAVKVYIKVVVAIASLAWLISLGVLLFHPQNNFSPIQVLGLLVILGGLFQWFRIYKYSMRRLPSKIKTKLGTQVLDVVIMDIGVIIVILSR